MNNSIKKERKTLKSIFLILIGIIFVFFITSCTKSFSTKQDNANKLFNSYGNIYNQTLLIDESYTDEYDYNPNNDTDRTKLIKLQNKNRETLFKNLSMSNGYIDWFSFTNDSSSNQPGFLAYMNSKVDDFVTTYYSYWMEGINSSLDHLKDEKLAKSIAKHVAIFAGVELDEQGKPKKVAPLFSNMNSWYKEAERDLGILSCPGEGYLKELQKTITSTAKSNTIGITPVNMEITQNGGKIYIEGKSWGQAFKEYGFLEGLFVYPLSCLAHYIITGLGNSGWAVLLAVLVITLLVRSITVFSSILQSKTQAKQTKIQPKLNELDKKYPDADTDKEQKQAKAMEQAQIMKGAKMHPFLPLLFMLIQFPLFICVWSALQGSAAMSNATFLGLSLTTLVSTCFTAASTTSGAVTGIFIFILMSIANILSTMTSMWFQSWRTKKYTPELAQPKKDGTDPNKMTKIMSYVMMVFVVIMGWNLPTGMGIYWFIGAVISILQTLLTELMHKKERHKADINGGTNINLAQIRKSKNHNSNTEQTSKTDKPLWRN